MLIADLLTQKLLQLVKPKKTIVVPPNSFCFAFNNFAEQIFYEGEHKISKNYSVTPPVSLEPHTIVIGYDYERNKEIVAFYKLTIKYKITDPYLYIMKSDRGEYVSASATDLVHMILWNKEFNEIQDLLNTEYVFQGPAAEMIFNSMDEYGVKILSASCSLSSIEEIRSVPHYEKTIELGHDYNYVRGYFYNSTGLSEDDIPS